MFASRSSIETFQCAGRRTTCPGFSKRRWAKARRQASSSALSLVRASLETQSRIPSSLVKLLGKSNTHCQKALAEPGCVNLHSYFAASHARASMHTLVACSGVTAREVSPNTVSPNGGNTAITHVLHQAILCFNATAGVLHT